MKFLLIATFTVLCIAGVYSDSPEELRFQPISDKEKLRARLLFELDNSNQNEIQSFCPHPLTPEEIVLGNARLESLIQCGNATIDKFISKLDDSMNFNEKHSFGEFVRVYSAPACAIFNDIFECISPVVEICLNEEQKKFKNKVFGIIPLINQTICIHIGGLIADIIQLEGSAECLTRAIDRMDHVDFIELFESESDVLFGNANVCQKFNNVLQDFYVKLGECSVDVLRKVKDMFGYICERTPCVQHVNNFKCN